MASYSPFQLLIHGGAGQILQKEDYTESIATILSAGRSLLADGAPAISVVERCVQLLEDDPLFNAGRGSVLNSKGGIEMDAAIMEGNLLAAGSVAGIWGVKNPVSLARRVMEETEHVMLIGEGAVEFARLIGAPFEEDDYFLTERRIEQWHRAKKANQTALDHDDPTPTRPSSHSDRKFGTVGAVARDSSGNLAAATSTGGITNKQFGRVGDSPIIGAGVFADNETCAVSATGHGEGFLRTTIAKRIAEYIAYQGRDAQAAADAAIAHLKARVGGVGGVIVIDRAGHWGSSFSSAAMIHGRADADGIVVMT
jgi:beta-aspartyl-peptidase (threonine type)